MKPVAPSMEISQGAAEAASLRRCLATGQSAEKDRLIRFVASPEGELVADIYGRLGVAGRGSAPINSIWKRPVPKICLPVFCASL